MRWHRHHHRASYTYTLGVFPTIELLTYQSRHVLEILLHSSAKPNSGIAKIQALCQQANIPVSVNDKNVHCLSQKENVYAVGIFEKYDCDLDPDTNHVVLVQPADTGNAGTIVRTMLGFGFNNLAIIRPAIDIFDPSTIRASMGALFQVQFSYFNTFEAYYQAFSHHIYSFMTDGHEALQNVHFEKPFSLVFGSESRGLSPAFHAIGTSVQIPHCHAIDSFNLSIAVGIGLYGAASGELAKIGFSGLYHTGGQG